MLVGIVPDPLCTASAGCRLRICAKCFYNKKEHRGLPQKWEESSVFSAYRVCAFSLVAFSSMKKISTFFCAFISSCISSVPASHHAPCGRLDKQLSFEKAVWSILCSVLLPLAAFSIQLRQKWLLAARCSVICSRCSSRNFLLYPALR